MPELTRLLVQVFGLFQELIGDGLAVRCELLLAHALHQRAERDKESLDAVIQALGVLDFGLDDEPRVGHPIAGRNGATEHDVAEAVRGQPPPEGAGASRAGRQGCWSRAREKKREETRAVRGVPELLLGAQLVEAGLFDEMHEELEPRCQPELARRVLVRDLAKQAGIL